MKFILKIFLTVFLLVCPFSFSAQFGQYQYTNYNAINQQLILRRNQARLQAMRQNNSPVKNIRYPNSYTRYPNIERNAVNKRKSQSATSRFSSKYYQQYAGYKESL